MFVVVVRIQLQQNLSNTRFFSRCQKLSNHPLLSYITSRLQHAGGGLVGGGGMYFAVVVEGNTQARTASTRWWALILISPSFVCVLLKSAPTTPFSRIDFVNNFCFFSVHLF